MKKRSLTLWLAWAMSVMLLIFSGSIKSMEVVLLFFILYELYLYQSNNRQLLLWQGLLGGSIVLVWYLIDPLSVATGGYLLLFPLFLISILGGADYLMQTIYQRPLIIAHRYNMIEAKSDGARFLDFALTIIGIFLALVAVWGVGQFFCLVYDICMLYGIPL